MPPVEDSSTLDLPNRWDRTDKESAMSRDRKPDVRVGVNRREFFRASAVGCALALAGPTMIPSAQAAPESEAAPGPFELDEVTVAQLQAGMQSGQWTAQSLAEKYLARIEAVDKKGPAVNAVIELNPEAVDIAAALDKERKEKGARGPLHGIPVLIKDNIATADR